MILSSAPKIDQRTAADVAEQLQALLQVYAPEWKEVDPNTGAPTGVSAALIGIASGFAEVLIQRLNQVPQKNFLAFLQLLGAALLPPQPARAPVTFLLAQGSLTDAVVPAGTQVAAPPGPGEKDPVIYETEHELVATAAQLAWAIVRDPDEDTYADYSNDIIAAGSFGTDVFHGNQPMEHILYLGTSQFLNSSGISKLSLTFVLAAPVSDALSLKWEIWNGTAWTDITPSDSANDGTERLHKSGTIQFVKVPAAQPVPINGLVKEWLRCRLLTPITRSSLPRNGMVRASQLPAILSVRMSVHLHNDGLLIDEAFSSNSGLIDLSKDFYPFGEKPRFNDTLWLALEEAFSNASATVTLAITVTTPPGSSTQTPPTAVPSPDLRLRWEIWNGTWVALGTSSGTGPVAPFVSGFTDTTNVFTKDGSVTFTLPPGVRSFNVNGKESFWVRVRIISGNYGVEGHFELKKPAPQPPESPYVFVLPTFQPPSIKSLTVMYDLDKPALAQPAALPEAVLAYNDSSYTNVTAINTGSTQTFAPFQPSPDRRPTLYLGFVLPTGRITFPNTTITMFFRGGDLQYGQKTIPLFPDVSRGAGDPDKTVVHKFVLTNPGLNGITYTPGVLGTQWPTIVSFVHSDGSPGGASPSTITVPPGDWVEIDVQVTVPGGTPSGASDIGILQLQLLSPDQRLYTAEFITFAHEEGPRTQQLQLTWEYWSGQKWTALIVRDETSNLTTTGIVEFLAPPDFVAHTEFGKDAWWLRVRWDAGDYDTDPRVARILLNTTMAAQTVTVRNEVLGSADGSASQIFQTTRTPVLAGQSLIVREPEMPSGDDLQAIFEDEGANAVLVIPDSAGKPSEIWVTWHEVPDFYASDSRSRHYTLDHITGEVSFGDGVNGMAPPMGSANLRLVLYKTGGGVRGNRPAGSILQLKTTVPYVDRVTNYLAATGGVDAESMDSLVGRVPTEIRHRHRSVTPEDYEDLAHLASSDVVRTLCVPNRDLVADPFDQIPPVLGNVSLIIVPNTTDPKPQPSVELIRRVQQFISASCPVTATALVVGPLYLRVNVQAEIGLASLDVAGTLALSVQNALAAFLHPLTGGFDGRGWEFGREPHRSDIYRVVEEIPGVDHIRALTVQSTADLPLSRETGRFLVYSGTHSIKLVFEP